MAEKHKSACGRRLARDIAARLGTKEEAVAAVHAHCRVSLLRAHRIAYGYTLLEVAELLKTILRERGTPFEGLAHQRVSRWENGLDMPTRHYLDALCYLYRTRPDRLGFGHDYSWRGPHHAAPATPAQWRADDMRRRDFLRSTTVGVVVGSSAFDVGSQLLGATSAGDAVTVDVLEEQVERSGRRLYIDDPADFVPARMAEIAAAQRLLLGSGQTLDAQRRLHRVVARNAGFIGITLTDISDIEETFNWFQVARRAGRQAGDTSVEAWLAGHWADAYSCFGYSLKHGLDVARAAQTLGGARPSSAAVIGLLVEAGIQARLGHRTETVDAVHRANHMFAVLPDEAVVQDGIHISEYFLRWHQANALAVAGEKRLADVLRRRAIELPFSSKDFVGRVLLELDEAELAFGTGELDRGCQMITQVWNGLPAQYQVGQIQRRTKQIIGNPALASTATREVRALREYVRAAGGSLA